MLMMGAPIDSSEQNSITLKLLQQQSKISNEYFDFDYPIYQLDTGVPTVLVGYNWSEAPITDINDQLFFLTDHDYVYASPWLKPGSQILYCCVARLNNPLVLGIVGQAELCHDYALRMALEQGRDSIVLRQICKSANADYKSEILLLNPKQQILSIQPIQPRNQWLEPYQPPYLFEPPLQYRPASGLATENYQGVLQVTFKT